MTNNQNNGYKPLSLKGVSKELIKYLTLFSNLEEFSLEDVVRDALERTIFENALRIENYLKKTSEILHKEFKDYLAYLKEKYD